MQLNGTGLKRLGDVHHDAIVMYARLCLWVRTMAQVGTLQGSVGGQDHTARLLALAALPGGLLCSGGDDSKIIVWNTTAVPPVKLVQWTGHSGSVFALAAVGPGTFPCQPLQVTATYGLWSRGLPRLS